VPLEYKELVEDLEQLDHLVCLVLRVQVDHPAPLGLLVPRA